MDATDLGTFCWDFSSNLAWFSCSLCFTSTNFEVSHSRLRLAGVLGAEGIFSLSSLGSRICARTMGSLAAAPVREAFRVFLPPGMARGAVRLFSSLWNGANKFFKTVKEICFALAWWAVCFLKYKRLTISKKKNEIRINKVSHFQNYFPSSTFYSLVKDVKKLLWNVIDWDFCTNSNFTYSWFHKKGTFSDFSFNNDYLSIPERPGS